MAPECPLPVHSVDLIDDLSKSYPAQCIGLGETLEAAHRYAGKRELIEELLAWKEEMRGGSLGDGEP